MPRTSKTRSPQLPAALKRAPTSDGKPDLVDADRVNNFAASTLVDIDKIDLDVTNHRQAMDETKLQQLVQTINDHGLQQPVLVYEKAGTDRYILGFGFRRLEAHRRLKLKQIRAVVRPPAPEAEIRQNQAIENLQREDLTPLEEANAVGVLVAAEDGDMDKVAAMIGWEIRLVERRLALLRLSPRVQQMLLDGDIYLKHAELLARLVSHETQEEIAGRFKGGPSLWDRTHIDHPAEAYKWKNAIDAELRSLHDVNWRLDVEFAGKPACSDCTSNSANALMLFDGDAPKKAQCLNRECYGVKSKAAVSAVTRATTNLTKMGGPLTPKNAAKAIEERNAAEVAKDPTRRVDFVDPRAVAQRAKYAMQPAKASKSTPAERRGAQQGAEDEKAKSAWHKACLAWRNKAANALDKSISDQTRQLLWLLAQSVEIWDLSHDYGGRIKKARAKFDRLMAKVVSGDMNGLFDAAMDDRDAIDELDEGEWPLQQAIAALGISFDEPVPLLEDFKKKAKPAATVEAKPPRGEARTTKTSKKKRRGTCPDPIGHIKKYAAKKRRKAGAHA